MNEQQNTSLPPVPPADKPAIPVIVPVPGWFSYSGRYTRAQFWGKWLVCILILVVISHIIRLFLGVDLAQTIIIRGGCVESISYQMDCFISHIISQMYVLTIITYIELIVYTLLLLPLLVKRLHDIGMPTIVAVGVWVLIQGLGFVEVSATIIDSLKNTLSGESLDLMYDGTKELELMYYDAERKMQGLEQTYTIIRGCIGIVMLIVLCLDSQKGTNLYGPSSKYPDAQ